MGIAVIDELNEIQKQATSEIEKESGEGLEDLRVKYLGRKSRLAEIMRGLKDIPKDKRPEVGKLANEIRQAIEESLSSKVKWMTANQPAFAMGTTIASQIKSVTSSQAAFIQGEEEPIDITKPGRVARLGSKHIITQIIEEIVEIFVGLGYRMVETGEVETEYYNFTALNTPEDHPARTLQATFYLESPAKSERERTLLRTQTSPAQIRVMEKTRPPLYVVVPGKVFRPDVPDPTHSPMFHQVEGFAVDKEITFGDLKGTLEAFCEKIFGADRKVRFRPHFFPFTEPSAEVDVSCIVCGGKGCRICSQTGWLEILGAGMIDPNVFDVVGYDPEEVSGFAFGMAPDRIAMLKYGITDIRMFFENDVRFLSQFI